MSLNKKKIESSYKFRKFLYPISVCITIFFCISHWGCENKNSSISEINGLPVINIASLVKRRIKQRSSWSTQCLDWSESDILWQTSGHHEQSYLLRYNIRNETLSSKRVAGIFIEGCTYSHPWLFVLTWQSFVMHVYDTTTLELVKTFSLSTEGWGLDFSDKGLVYSDGSATLRWLSNEIIIAAISNDDVVSGMLPSLPIIEEKTIYDPSGPVFQLNELEWFEEFLLANVYPGDRVAVIRPESAQVIAWLELGDLRRQELELQQEHEVGVTNGIAYQSTSKNLLVTGKHWSFIYEVAAKDILDMLR